MADKLFEDFFAWRMAEFPEFASFCGFHQHDHLLNDHSPSSFDKRKTASEEFLARCQVILKSDDLTKDDRLSLELFGADLNDFLDGIKYEGYLSPISYGEGMHVDFEQLTSWMVFNEVVDFKKYVARLRALPDRLSSDIELMKMAIEKKKTYHKCSVEVVPEQISKLQKPVQESIFMAPFLTDSATGLECDDLRSLREEAAKLATDSIYPAFARLATFVEKDYLPTCRPEPGVGCLPGGDTMYARCLLWHVSTPVTPQQVHEVGVKEMARIRQQMEQVMKKIGFEGDFQAFLNHLKDTSNKQFYFNSQEEFLSAFKDVCYNQIRPKLCKLFPKIPESKLTPSYDMMCLALHEGEPGHHFQGMYAMETTSLPSFRRYLEDMYYNMAPSRFPLHTAYAEGWGLYCEYLGNELGLYEDPYSLFGHLSFDMHRACRLVADTGIHTMGWSVERAVQLFLSNTALAEHSVRQEVRRYCTWPGQACAYKIGQLHILKLRKKAEDKLGSAFSIHEFHDLVLRVGMMSMANLESQLDDYITSRTKTAA